MLDTVRRDLSYTARSLRRAPAFAVTVVLILGLAIGMSSAMFTVFRSVLVERLPVTQQDRIVELSGIAGGAASEVPISPDQLRRFQQHPHTIQSVSNLAHWRSISDSFTDGDRRLTLIEAVVGDEFFSVLGANPALGRLFRKGDAIDWGAGATVTNVPVVLSHAAWQRVFGGDSSVIGHVLRAPKLSWSMTIVGIAPPGLDYPRGVELWIAANYGSVDVVARLAPGATPEAARKEFQAFLAHDPDEVRYMGAGSAHRRIRSTR